MSQNPYEHVQPAPYSQPPAQPGPGEAPPTRRSNWPTAVGAISIAVASLFLLFTLVGAANPAAKFSGPQAAEFEKNLPEWFQSWKWASLALSSSTYVLLIAAGLLLLKRRPAARPLHLVYVVLAVIQTVVGTVLTLRIMEYVPLPANVPPAAMSIFKVSLVIGAVLGVAIGLAYPTFVLIWFLRGRIAREMRAWGAS